MTPAVGTVTHAHAPSDSSPPLEAGAASVASEAAALRLDGIGLSFGGVAALTDVDFDVRRGEIRAVIGPNGAGKSSLVNVITGIYKPDRGRITLDGHTFARVPTNRLARLGVARTFQNLALFKGLNVRDNVAAGLASDRRAGLVEQVIGLGRARREREEAIARADVILDAFGLRELRDRSIATLPYGLQKRVELARALVARPKLVLLDEPMAGMSEDDKRDMVALIRGVRDTHGTTVVMIEHDIGIVMDLSDRIAVLDYGRKIADGTPAHVRDDPAVIDAYLGVAHEEPALSQPAEAA